MDRTRIAFVTFAVLLLVNLSLSAFLFYQVVKLRNDIDVKLSSPIPSISDPAVSLSPSPFPSTGVPSSAPSNAPFSGPTSVPTSQPNPTAYAQPTVSNQKKLPAAIQGAYSWPIQSVCRDNSGYQIYYQLDDGTNIYTYKGNYVRGKSVICTNAE